MYRFFETILVDGGEPKNIEYHNKRLNKTMNYFYGSKSVIDLNSVLSAPNKERWKCKVTYSQKIEKIEWFVLKPRTFRSFRIVSSNLAYPFKSTQREALEALFDKRGNNDEVIIIKDGLITDTTISNIAIFSEGRWLTPRSPLLEGTTRERLLDEGKIFEADINLNRLKSAKRIAMINALIGFYEIDRPIFEE